jgi:hypothetical protein
MRTPNRTTRVRVLLVFAVSAALALTSAAVASATLPNKFLLTSHFGWEVNKTTGASICAAKEECQSGRESSEPVGFSNPLGVAIDNDPASASYEHVYVSDRGNKRVQELTASGQFVSMFGWDVNRTKVEAAAPQAERNVCTAASTDVCQAGVGGTAPGQFGLDDSIAVDSTSGDVYVSDTTFGEIGGEFALAQRVQKFTAAGQFVLEIGKEVNETTKSNLCVAAEACGGAAFRTVVTAEADSEVGAFSFQFGYGNMLAVGGPSDLLYVGDQGRVQEFKAAGESAGKEVSLAALSPSGKATGIAVDPAGDVFASDSEALGVHEYDASGVLQPSAIDAGAVVEGLALDPHGRLGIIEAGEGVIRHGVFYSAAGVKISEFAPPSGVMSFSRGLAFAASNELYVAGTVQDEVEAYAPVVFPEARTCVASEVTGTSAKLCGEINPDGVHASGFFKYGKSSTLGSLTPVLFEGESEAFEPLSFQLTSLEPNQTYRYRVVVEAQAGGEMLQANGEEMAFRTAVVAPQISGQPSASFVKAQSAVLNASVNPEHAATRYHYEYGACPTLAGCAVQSTPDEVSSVFGAIGSSWELVGLAPSTTYSYRLVASNEFEEAGKTLGGKATGAEGSFTTSPAPAPSAETGTYGALTSTSAIISGMVNPDGLPASYVFELGVYNGTGTQYGIVFSGPAGSNTVPIEEELALTGLQPGTTYAYRITVSSGYIGNESHTVQGAPVTFTTLGLPSVLVLPPVLTQLPIPNISFPKGAKIAKKKAKTPRQSKKVKRKAKAKKGKKTR